MKSFLKIILATLCLSFLSCSSDTEDDASALLKVEISESPAIIIPAPATTLSCEQIAKGDLTKGSIAGAYFTLPNPSFTWNQPETETLSEVRILVLKMTIKSAQMGGEYSCIFSDIALGTLYFDRDTTSSETVVVNGWDGKLYNRSTAGKYASTKTMVSTGAFSACDIKCGGISIPTGSGQFSATGQWEVIAVQKKYSTMDNSGTYEEFPLKVQGTFNVQNTLN
jgi:hypothetical protein